MTRTPSTALRLPLLALVLASGTPAAMAQTVGSPAPAARLAIGDLSTFRTIASDTLAIVDKGEIPVARARVKDLETAWDKAKPTLKPRDKANWTRIDKLIDGVLTDLRSPSPKPATCAASLRALLDGFDAVGKA